MMTALLAAGISIAGLGVIPGCGSGSWRSSAGDGSPEAFRPLAAELAKVGYTWDWSGFTLPSSGERVQFIQAYADVIVAQDTSGRVTALEPNTGRVRWTNDLMPRGNSRVTKYTGLARDTASASGDRILSAAESELFIVDLRTGEVRTRQRLEKVVNTRPVVVGSFAIFGTSGGEIMGHLLSTGLRAWGYDSPGPIESSPVRVGGTIGAVTQGGYVAFVDPSNGSLIGRAKIFGGLSTNPVSDGNLMFVASLDQSLYGIAPSGQIAWRYRTSQPITGQPAVVNRTVFCTTTDDGLAAFDAAHGVRQWSTKDADGAVVGVRKGKLLVWNGKTMFQVDPQRGTILEKAELPGLTLLTTDAPEDGNLYAVNSAGVVGKFLPK